MKNWTRFILVTISLSLFTSLLAQPPQIFTPEVYGMSTDRLERIQTHFQSYLDDELIAGMQYLIARNGKIVHFESMGYADIETKKPLEEESIFRIYSMSKPITSVALMMLYEEGRFQLNDPVSKYIPSFANLKVVVKDDKSSDTRPAARQMKIVDLFRHTSGLGYGWGPRNYVDSLYAVSNMRGAKDLSEFTEIVAGLPLYYDPGTKWRYSISTDVLGYLVEVISGRKLDEYLQTEIFDPLGMEDTFFGVPADKINRYTTCYRPVKEGGLEVQDHPSTSRFAKEVTLFSGGGGLQSTTYDYWKFSQMLLNGGIFNGHRFLSPKTIELMTIDHTKGIVNGGRGIDLPNQSTGFGLGFSVNLDLASTENLGSEGSYGWGGAAGTYFVIDPEEDLILIQMIQLMPNNHLNHRDEFHTLVYQALVD